MSLGRPSFADVVGRAERLFDAGERTSAYGVMREESPAYPGQAALSALWFVRYHAAQDDADAALAVLRESRHRGHRFRASWLRDPRRFASLQGRPEFEALVAAFDEAMRAAQADARPDRVARTGSRGTGATLVVLHGNNSNAEETLPAWSAALDAGWRLVVLQSSEVACTPGYFTWNDTDRAVAEVGDHLSALLREPGTSRDSVSLGGFSMGATQALRIACTGSQAVRAAIAVAPWLPDLRGFERIAAPAGLRVQIVVGRRDASGHDGALALGASLRSNGVVADVEVHDDLGHAYPDDFGATLRRVLGEVAMSPR